ncbi:MAG: NfeD family protein [Pseudomonadales bacterium]
MYAFQVLPVSYAGLALILLGIALMTAEAFAPSFGILGLGGVVAFAIGSIILMDTELPGYQIAMPLIAGFTAFSAVLLMVALGLVLKARKSAVVSGLETLIGKTAVVESLRDGEAYIWLEGERWHVQSSKALEVNDSVRIVDTDGVLLKAEKVHQKG